MRDLVRYLIEFCADHGLYLPLDVALGMFCLAVFLLPIVIVWSLRR